MSPTHWQPWKNWEWSLKEEGCTAWPLTQTDFAMPWRSAYNHSAIRDNLSLNTTFCDAIGEKMAISVRLDEVFVEEAQVYAEAAKRSVPKQIEHWAEIGRVVEDNPDLTYEFIKDALLASVEINAGKSSKYVKRKKTDN